MSNTETAFLELAAVNMGSTELERAQRHLASALDKLNAASATVGAANTDASRLVSELQNALAGEKAAAEAGLATPDLTEAVRSAQDKIRLHGYRLKKLETDAAMAQSDYADAFRVLQSVELQVAHVKAGAAADEFDAALNAAAEAKQKYLSALSEVRGAAAGAAGADMHDYSPDNIARVIRWIVTLQLLPEMCGGKDYNGQPIESAADIRQVIGTKRLTLLR